MHRAIVLTGAGSGSIRLPAGTSRWQVVNGSALPVTLSLVEAGGQTSGTFSTIAAGATSIVMLPPDPSCYIRAASGSPGGVVWILTSDLASDRT
jgi:hypothetical protein